jgi:hypothetical protein
MPPSSATARALSRSLRHGLSGAFVTTRTRGRPGRIVYRVGLGEIWVLGKIIGVHYEVRSHVEWPDFGPYNAEQQGKTTQASENHPGRPATMCPGRRYVRNNLRN